MTAEEITQAERHELSSSLLDVALLAILGLLALLLAICAGIAHSITPQYGDSATFYYEAMLLLRGGRPYLDFIDNKNPGIYCLLWLPAHFFRWDMLGSVIF